MNIFNQAKNETVVINGEIYVTVLNILEDEGVLAIDAPQWIEVCRRKRWRDRKRCQFSPVECFGGERRGRRLCVVRPSPCRARTTAHWLLTLPAIALRC